MKLTLPMPGHLLPDALTSSVSAGAGAVRDGLGAVFELVPRIEMLIERIDAVVGGAERTVARVDAVLGKVEASQARVDETVTAIERTRERADTVATRVGSVVDGAEQVSGRVIGVVEGAGGTLDRVAALLGGYEPLLQQLAPSAKRLVSSLEGREVDAAVALVDRLPVVLQHLDEDVLPILQQMERVGPDVHELLAAVEDVRRMLTGLPGAKLFWRRGDDEPASGG